MALFQVAYNKTTKVAAVQPDGTALPAGSVKAGTFTHDAEDETGDPLAFPVNHVLFHHVRDVLYKASAETPNTPAMFPENITDLGSIKILLNPASAISTTPANASIAVDATQQLTTVAVPAGANAGSISYSSSDETKATVDANGLVTGIAAGAATITATSSIDGFTDTVAITVTA